MNVTRKSCGILATTCVVLSLGITFPCEAQTPGLTRFAKQEFPEKFSKQRVQSFIQQAVDSIYLRGFWYLGEAEDFNHGHILAVSGKPVAILYHTQEGAYYNLHGGPQSRAGYLDPKERNWIQWLDGRVVDARMYERATYPDTPAWGQFVKESLPVLRAYYTIIPEMLDPKAFGGEVLDVFQWFFVRASCLRLGENIDPNSNAIAITLPSSERVCLLLMNTEHYRHLYE